MKKHKNKILAGFILVVLLIVAFRFGGDVQEYNKGAPEPEKSMNVVKQYELNETVLQETETSDILLLEEIEKEKKTEAEQKNQENPTEKEEIVKELVPEKFVPAVKIEEKVDSDEELTCILSVRCDTILDNMSRMDSSKVNIVPKDGVIFAEKTVTFYEGETVFNVLLREMKRNKIHMEFEMTPAYETAYIKGIANIYEFDCGEFSGWLYKVNNKSANVGCSLYHLKDGDRIEWIYTCG